MTVSCTHEIDFCGKTKRDLSEGSTLRGDRHLRSGGKSVQENALEGSVRAANTSFGDTDHQPRFTQAHTQMQRIPLSSDDAFTASEIRQNVDHAFNCSARNKPGLRPIPDVSFS